MLAWRSSSVMHPGEGRLQHGVLFWGAPGFFTPKILHLSKLSFSVMFKSCEK